MMLTILGLSLADLVGLVFTPTVAVIVGFFKMKDVEKEKHKISQQEETARHQATILAEAERDKRKIEAEVEKEHVRSEVEIAKIKETSVGGEAVAKIWKAFDNANSEIIKLKEVSREDHSNDAIIKEALNHLQTTVNGLMNSIFEKLLKSN